jgi:hypothetical protein
MTSPEMEVIAEDRQGRGFKCRPENDARQIGADQDA